MKKNQNKTVKAPTVMTAHNVEKIKEELSMALSGKDKLFKEVNKLSGDLENTEVTYKRMLIQLAQLLRSDKANKDQYKAIDNFSGIIKKKKDLQSIESAFLNLKNAIFKASAKGQDDVKKTGSFFSKFIKGDVTPLNTEIALTNYYHQLQDSYKDVVNELKLLFGKKYLQRLLKLGKKIHNADSLEKFDEVRNNLINIFQDYINDIDTDREKASEYVVQIIKKIFVIEKYLLGSLEYVQDSESKNSNFSDILSEQLEKLKGKTEISRTFEELKNTVDTSVSSIIDVIKEKKNIDSNRKKELNKKIMSLQKNLIEMKGEIKSANKRASQLEKEILEDSLTGINNRKSYDRFLNEELQRFIRYKTTFSMLIFDVDHFKKFNDNYGHAVGDKCLQEIVKYVKPVLRENDFFARYGGEEFVIILPETDKEGAVEASEKVRQAVEKIAFLHKGQKVLVTVSVGATEVQSSDTNGIMMFNRADDALYDAKNSGRNRVVFK